MRLASVLHNPRVGPVAMTPMHVLEMATLHGARALGLEDEVGSVEAGKRADLTVVDTRGFHFCPLPEDVTGPLVYSARSTDVSHVLIDGKLVLREGELTTLDANAVLANARTQATKLFARAKLKAS